MCKNQANVKFAYSEKAINFCEISTVDLSYLAFSEYMNFKVATRYLVPKYTLHSKSRSISEVTLFKAAASEASTGLKTIMETASS